jgi:hypothetical protein
MAVQLGSISTPNCLPRSTGVKLRYDDCTHESTCAKFHLISIATPYRGFGSFTLSQQHPLGHLPSSLLLLCYTVLQSEARQTVISLNLSSSEGIRRGVAERHTRVGG